MEANRLIGKSLFKFKRLYNEEGIKQINRQFLQAIKNKKVLNFYQNFTSEGETKNFFITIIPELSGKDEYENILLIARDITGTSQRC